jgi:hypothetical protein
LARRLRIGIYGHQAGAVIGQPYLFKLRQTSGVKQLIKRNWSRQDWQNVGQGGQAVAAELALTSKEEQRRRTAHHSCTRQRSVLTHWASLFGTTKLRVIRFLKEKRAVSCCF